MALRFYKVFTCAGRIPDSRSGLPQCAFHLDDLGRDSVFRTQLEFDALAVVPAAPMSCLCFLLPSKVSLAPAPAGSISIRFTLGCRGGILAWRGVTIGVGDVTICHAVSSLIRRSGVTLALTVWLLDGRATLLGAVASSEEDDLRTLLVHVDVLVRSPTLWEQCVRILCRTFLARGRGPRTGSFWNLIGEDSGLVKAVLVATDAPCYQQ